jgi:hypothetical protein
MNTLYLSAGDPKTPAIAANIIMQGGLVAIPTETVYGLGANGLDENAVIKIFEAKGRPQDNPLILHIAGAEQIEQFAHHIPQAAYDLAERLDFSSCFMKKDTFREEDEVRIAFSSQIGIHGQREEILKQGRNYPLPGFGNSLLADLREIKFREVHTYIRDINVHGLL